jgi:hypothetical protein
MQKRVPAQIPLSSPPAAARREGLKYPECDAPVTAFYFIMMYNHGVGRKKDDGKRKGVYHKQIGIPFGL